MMYPQLPTAAFIAAILVLIPIPWHWRARNIATLALTFWLFSVNVIFGINSIIWAGNVENPVPVWCDITTKIVVGVSYALPLATLCICRHLEMVSSSRKVSYDSSDRTKRMIFEAIMCFGVPFIFMALHYVVQGHRYDIVENVGCNAAVYVSIQAVLIIWFPQLLFAFITFIYAALALHNFIRRRLTFAAHLQNSNSALTTNRYLRLIAMALTEMIWGTSLTAFNLYSNVYPGLRPWTDWADVHSNFSRVGLFPSAFVPPEVQRTVMLLWWTLPISSLIFFVFFAFGEEAMKEYRKYWTWIKVKVFRRPQEKKSLKFPEVQKRPAIRNLRVFELRSFTSMGPNAESPSKRISNYKWSSPPTSPGLSHCSSATLAPPNTSGYGFNFDKTHDKSKSMDALEAEDRKSVLSVTTNANTVIEPAPAYHTLSSQVNLIGLPIRVNLDFDLENSLPTMQAPSDLSRMPSTTSENNLRDDDNEDSDAMTVSTISYYASPSSPPPPLPSSPIHHSLPPPPRRLPRGVPLSISEPPGVPQRRSSVPMLHSTSPPARRVLGVDNGGIWVTVHRQASVDHFS